MPAPSIPPPTPARGVTSATALGSVSRYLGSITGDGTSTSFALNHGLNTSNPALFLRDSQGNRADADSQVQSPGTLLVQTAQPLPAGYELSAIVIGCPDSLGNVPAATIALLTSLYPSTYVGSITGDGTDTSFTIAHELGTLLPLVQVRTSTGASVSGITTSATDANHVVITFPTAPSAGAIYGYVVLGGGTPIGPGGPRTLVADANYTAKVTDQRIALTSIATSRTLTLPAASAYSQDEDLIVGDETGLLTESMTLTIVAAGSDMIAGQTDVVLSQPYQRVRLSSNGSNLWTY